MIDLFETPSWQVTASDGGMHQWESSDYPNWRIYEQPKGFFIWHKFKYHVTRLSFDDAKDYVEANYATDL